MMVRRPVDRGFRVKAAGMNVDTARVSALVAVLLLLLFIVGCGPKKELAQDPFFEKWSTLAEESQGSSPVARERVHDIPGDPSESVVTQAELQRKAEQRELPKNAVTLKMRNADVPTVLRALARAADQNILMRTEVTGTVSVDFDRVPWDEAFVGILRSRGLSYMWEGNIIRVATFECLENELRWEKIKEQRMEREILRSRMAPLHTMVIPVDYANAQQMRENLLDFLTKKEDGQPYGSIRVNEHTNSLVVQATRADLERIVPLIDKMDQPTAQIRIEASIVETTSDTARDLGVQWGGLYTNVAGSGRYSADSGADFPIPATRAAEGIASLGFGYLRDSGSFLEMQLQALQSSGVLNILSRPSITTLDNQMAFTENGQRVPFVTLDSDGDQTVEWEDAVLRLEITPHVIDDDTMKMTIVIKKDEVDFTQNVRGNPFIIKKQTNTTLIVRNGETIVISGLSKQQDRKGDAGVPLLSDVPGFGWLFKRESKSKEMEEVLIFITPRILKTEMPAPRRQG